MTEVYPDVPNPGSDEALDDGCLCAVIDNNHGSGRFGAGEQFVTNLDCPIHAPDWEVPE